MRRVVARKEDSVRLLAGHLPSRRRSVSEKWVLRGEGLQIGRPYIRIRVQIPARVLHLRKRNSPGHRRPGERTTSTVLLHTGKPRSRDPCFAWTRIETNRQK